MMPADRYYSESPEEESRIKHVEVAMGEKAASMVTNFVALILNRVAAYLPDGRIIEAEVCPVTAQVTFLKLPPNVTED